MRFARYIQRDLVIDTDRVERKTELPHRQERMPMMRRDTALGDPGKMRGRRVAHIALPAIAGIADGERAHHSVARDLRDDRRAGDAVTARVAGDDGSVGSPQ